MPPSERGRPPTAPGVGKNSKRHDLETPATPGLHGSDLQQGDVSRLEQAQQTAPIGKRTQPSASPARKPSRPQAAQQQQQGGMQIPDPIEFASRKIGGNNPAGNMEGQRYVDPTPWLPLLRSLATRPNSGGALASTLTDLLVQYRRRPVIPSARYIDMNEMDATIARNL